LQFFSRRIPFFKKAPAKAGAVPGYPGPLLDHIVSNGEQHGWDGQPERLGSLEVDYHTKLGRLSRN
jgi:hypothetical protein